MDDERIAKLTDKEREVLRFVQRRMTSKEIAPKLGITVDAVDARIKSATRKLDIPDRGKAALLLADYEDRATYPQLVYPPPEIASSLPDGKLEGPAGMLAREVQGPFLVDPMLVAGTPVSAKAEEGERNKLTKWQRLVVIAAVAIGTVVAIGIIVSALNGLVQLALVRDRLF